MASDFAVAPLPAVAVVIETGTQFSQPSVLGKASGSLQAQADEGCRTRSSLAQGLRPIQPYDRRWQHQ
jgi:hypothetical protein